MLVVPRQPVVLVWAFINCVIKRYKRPYHAEMARSRCALDSVLVPGAYTRDNIVFEYTYEENVFYIHSQ